MASAAATFQFFAAACETLEESITPSRGDFVSMSVYEPMGVVVAITPWNSPIASEAQKLAPALAAGNAVVVKPAEFTPLAALALARICDEAGLPRGLVSVLPGKGALIGDALTRHPLARRVSFTGGTRTGKHIARIAADKMMPVSLELGGKSPTMVLADADLDHAVAGVLYGIFSSSGESCIAGSRLFVASERYDEFMERLATGAAALRVGDPADERTQMGPLISARHRESVERYVEMGVAEGGRLRTGRTSPWRSLRSWLLLHPDHYRGAHQWRPPVPGRGLRPGAGGHAFASEEALIEEANDSCYALAAGIWTRDFQRAWRLGRAVQAGTVWINTYKQFSISTPSAAGATAAWAAKRAAWGYSSTWSRRASTGA